MKVRQPTTSKRQLVSELRTLANAIDITIVPTRIDQHLKDIIALAKKVQRQDITDNSYWLNN